MNVEARRAVEAILMVAEDPVDPHLLAQLIEVSPAELSAAIAELGAAYEAEGRGFVIAQVAGGYRFQSHPELAAYVERFVLEGQTARLSTAALETLAIIAYKQPISRAQVAAIRGVNVDGVVRTLEARGYIGEVGRDTGPGNAVLFGTTAAFLEKLGLNSLEDLPPIAQFVPGADVVEQLEHGLRFAPDDEAAPPEIDGHPDAAAAEAPESPEAEPAEPEPVDVEAADVEPVEVDAAEVEAADVEPVEVEPAEVEPAEVEAAEVETERSGVDVASEVVHGTPLEVPDDAPEASEAGGGPIDDGLVAGSDVARSDEGSPPDAPPGP